MPVKTLKPTQWFRRNALKQPSRVRERISVQCQAACAAAFVRDVRGRIRELGARGYIEKGETLDYLIAFIPNEAVYSFVHEQDPALVDDAMRQRVVLCSPFTLFAVLAVLTYLPSLATLGLPKDSGKTQLIQVLMGLALFPLDAAVKLPVCTTCEMVRIGLSARSRSAIRASICCGTS